MNVRRNVVVRHEDGYFYGRVIRVLPNQEVFWICSGYHFHITPASKLIVDGYKGYSIFGSGRFIPMTSLRNLKRRSARFHGKFSFNTPMDYEFIQRD